MSFPRILSIATLFALLVSPAMSQKRPAYLSPKEIVALTQNSSRSYQIKSEKRNQGVLADPFATLYPDAGGLVDPVRVLFGENGQRSYQRYPMTDEMIAFFKVAEGHFAAGRYAEARESYLRVVAIDPKFYQAYSYVGDTYFNEKHPELALAYYDTAVALNPAHYQAHYFRGSALRALGRIEEARESFVRALARNPRHESTFTLLRSYGAQLGFRANEVLFMPRGLAMAEGENVVVVFDKDAGAQWLSYAMAKAMWLGEPEHRKAMTGEEERLPFSTVEETECILALMSVYMNMREKGEIETDERLDRIVEIIDDDYLTEFLIYELGSRVGPQMMLMQTDDLISRMEKFVGKYVIVDRE